MNCQELNCVLDMHAPEELDCAHKRDIERHFASCPACREAWEAYDEFASAPIPKTPRGLHRRVEAALDEPADSDVHRARRSIIFGSVLVGAALATTLTLGLSDSERCMCPRT